MANARSNFPTRRPNSRDQEKEEIWKPMLDNISSGKRLPEKTVLVLGATHCKGQHRGARANASRRYTGIAEGVWRGSSNRSHEQSKAAG